MIRVYFDWLKEIMSDASVSRVVFLSKLRQAMKMSLRGKGPFGEVGG